MRWLSILLFFVLACRKEVTELPPNKEAHHEEAHEHEEVVLTPEQIQLLNIRTRPLEYRTLKNTVKCNGVLQLPPQQKATLNALIPGRVRAVYVIEGSPVRKGQTLALLEYPELLTLQSDYVSTIAQLAQLKKDYERKKQLYEDSLIDARTFQIVEAQYKATLAKKNALENQLRLLHISPERVAEGKNYDAVPVIAPINGFVQRVEVNIGSYVRPGQELFEITNNAHIHMHLKVYEKDIGKVRPGQRVYFRVTSYPDTFFEGRIFAIAKSFEADLRAVNVHAEIHEAPPYVLPGMYVDARIVVQEDKSLAVPEKALVKDGDDYYLWFSAKEDGKQVFLPVPVRVETKDMGYVAVKPLEKIPEDAQVVVEGMHYLQAQRKMATVELHEH